jgi:hypothetical protein
MVRRIRWLRITAGAIGGAMLLAAASGCAGGKDASSAATSAASTTATRAEIWARNASLDPKATATTMKASADVAAQWHGKVVAAQQSIPAGASGATANTTRRRLADLATLLAAQEQTLRAAAWTGPARCDERWFEALDRVEHDFHKTDPVGDLSSFAAWCDRTLFGFSQDAPNPDAAALDVVPLHTELRRYVTASLTALGASQADPRFAQGLRVMSAADVAAGLITACRAGSACDDATVTASLQGVDDAFFAAG